MYITVTWSSLNFTSTAAIEGEILAQLEALKFLHYFTPYDGVFHASIPKGQTQKLVQLLCNALLQPGRSPGRYSFVITVSPNAQPLWRSVNMTEPTFTTMVRYVT